MKQVCFFFFLLSSLQTFSQKVALKNNLAYDALLTPNLSVEFSLGKYNPQIQISVVSGTKRSIFRQKNKTKRSKKKAAHNTYKAGAKG